MNGIVKALAVAMLVFVALIPAMAISIPVTDIEKVGVGLTNGQITQDSASYAYTRTVADAAGNFKPQSVYSAVEFGADQGVVADGSEGYTQGEVVNTMQTAASNPLGITIQFVAQGGSATVTTAPASPSDAECGTITPVFSASMSTTNLAWISGDLISFTAKPESFGQVGGNYLDPVYNGQVTGCGNIWLTQTDGPEAITVTANTIKGGADTTLETAYAGETTSASLVAYPDNLLKNGNGDSMDVPADVVMSGFADKFAGYTADAGQGLLPASGQGGSVTINFGSDTNNGVTQSWNAAGGPDPMAPFAIPTTVSAI